MFRSIRIRSSPEGNFDKGKWQLEIGGAVFDSNDNNKADEVYVRDEQHLGLNGKVTNV